MKHELGDCASIVRNTQPQIRLALGNTFGTPGAIAAMTEVGQSATDFLERHARGDWGAIDSEDAAANDRAVEEGGRVLSAYILRNDVRLWVITEADRSSTTILLPDEY